MEIKKGKDVVVFDKDEGPRPGTTLEALAKLPPVFNHKSTVTGQPGGVTAGNAPGVNDGGDVVMLMSAEKAKAARPEAPLHDPRLRRGLPAHEGHRHGARACRSRRSSSRTT